MLNRRNFLLKGSLATTGVFASKPAGAVAKLQGWFPGFSGNKSYLTILHGTGICSKPDVALASKLSGNTFSPKSSHVLVVYAERPYSVEDNILLQQPDIKTGINFSVIQKGNQKIGIVRAPALPAEDWVKTIDNIAGSLKQKHRCSLVICAWQPNEVQIAKRSLELEMVGDTQHINVFVGSITSNKKRHTRVGINPSGNEVYFHYHSGGDSFSTMQFGFDAMGTRNHIAFA